MLAPLISLVLSQVAPSFTPEVKALCGNYYESTGFEVWSLNLRENKSATMGWAPDHPGGKSWEGTWSLKGDLVLVHIPAAERGKLDTYEYVPVKWGDFLLLIPRFLLIDFAIEEKAHVRRVAPETWHPRHMSRALRNPQPKRYGLPLAPAKFQQFFQDVKIGG